MKKSLVLVLAMLMVLSFALTACGPKTPAAEPSAPAQQEEKKEPQELVVNVQQEVGTLDWQQSSTSGEIEIYTWIMEGLTSNHASVIKPGMAEKWDVSPDGLVWTFHLRDAKWSDGVPVKAQDFKYGWMRAIDPKTPRDYTYFLYYIKGAEEYSQGKATADQVGIKVIDDKTLEVTLTTPVTYFDYMVSFITYAPVRQDIYEKHGTKFMTEPEFMVFNGPFKMESWKHESEMVFVKNPEYWDAASIKLDKATALIVGDESTEFNMYEADELDMTWALTGDQKPSMTKGEAKTYATGAVWFFDFNCKHPILKNKNIRKALTYAIDRQSFIDNVAKLPFKPALAFVQPEIIMDVDGKTPWRDAKPAYFKDNDVETAKKLLAQGMQELGITKIPKLKIMCNETGPAQKYSQVFQEMWKKNLDVDVELEPVPSAIRIDRQQAHDYVISLGGWGPDYPDPMTDLDLYVTGGGNNDPDFSNAEYDSLIKAGKMETDKAKKYEMMRKAEDILMEEMPIGPIYFNYRQYAIREYVKNMSRSALGAEIDFTYSYIEGKQK